MESIRSGPVAASGGGSDDKSNKLRQADYLAIGISAGLLGMLYVAGIVGYLCYRRRRRQLENVHVKLASSGGPAAPVPGTDASEDQTDGGIIRHNPLLQSNRSMMALNMQQNNLQSSRPSSRSSQHYKVSILLLLRFCVRINKNLSTLFEFCAVQGTESASPSRVFLHCSRSRGQRTLPAGNGRTGPVSAAAANGRRRRCPTPRFRILLQRRGGCSGRCCYDGRPATLLQSRLL